MILPEGNRHNLEDEEMPSFMDPEVLKNINPQAAFMVIMSTLTIVIKDELALKVMTQLGQKVTVDMIKTSDLCAQLIKTNDTLRAALSKALKGEDDVDDS